MKRLFTLICSIALFSACADYEENLKNAVINKNNNPWVDQILYVSNNKPEIYKDNNIKLVNYEVGELLSSTNEVEKIKQTLLDENSYFPIQSNDFKELAFKTRQEIMTDETLQKKYDFESIERSLDTLLTPGCQLIKLEWEYEGRPIETSCVVKKNGKFVYDNILSNFIVVNKTTTITNEPDKITNKKALGIAQRIKAFSFESGSAGGPSISYETSEFTNDYEALNGASEQIGTVKLTHTVTRSNYLGFKTICSSDARLKVSCKDGYTCCHDVRTITTTGSSSTAKFITIFGRGEFDAEIKWDYSRFTYNANALPADRSIINESNTINA